MQNNRKLIAFVSAAPISLSVFMRPHIKALSNRYRISVVSNETACKLRKLIPEAELCKNVRVERNISIFHDVKALVDLFLFFLLNKVYCVHSITPKAGLLTMIAAYIARVPVRIHVFTGQVWATKKGIPRLILKRLDQLTAFLATDLLTDSYSQKEYLVKNKITPAYRLTVLGSGSVCGVNINKFKSSTSDRLRIRKNINATNEDVVGLFIGRLNREKGVLDLLEAFVLLCKLYPNFKLLLVGPDEELILTKIDQYIGEFSSRLHVIGFTDTPEKFMSAADFLILPSYREGFGSVVIEAAACGLPAIVSRIYGLTDAVEEGKSGLMFKPRDVAMLSQSIETFIKDSNMRNRMGKYAADRANSHFAEKIVVDCMVEYYLKRVGS